MNNGLRATSFSSDVGSLEGSGRMCDWLKFEIPHMDLQMAVLRPVANSEVKAKEINFVRTNIASPGCKKSSGAASLISQYAATGQ